MLSPADSASHLLRATCSALETGDLEAASEQAAELRSLLPASPEGNLLEALCAERRLYPEAPWLDAFLSAWRSAGRPERFELLTHLDPLEPPGGLGALLKLAHTEHAPQVLAQALAQVRPEAPLAQRLTILALLRAVRVEGEDAARARAAIRTLLGSLASDYPGELYLQALAALEGRGPGEPLTQPELDALQAAAYRPRGALSVGHLYRLFREAYADEVGPVVARRRAFSDAIAVLPTDPLAALGRRAELTAQARPEEAPMLGRLLTRVAEVVASGRSGVERLLGALLGLQAARLLGDAAALARAGAELESARDAASASERLAIDRWPLPSLVCETYDLVATDEVSFVRKVMQA